MEKKRNYALDFFKGIACFGVVFFHVKMPGYYVDGVIQSMFRYTIPLFFMISGYYCRIKPEKKLNVQMGSKVKHIFLINGVGCLYYFLFQMLIALFGNNHGSLRDFIDRLYIIFNPRTLVEWIVFNQDPFIHIMWFTSALLYCYLIMWVIAKYNLYRVFYYLIPLLIMGHLMLGNVLYLFGIEIKILLYRNYLLFGLPFFMLGHLLQEKQEWVLSKITLKISCIFILVGAGLSVMEWFICARQELFVGSILMVLGMFCMAMQKPGMGENSFMTVIGQKYSLFIYILHISVGIVMDRFIGEPLMYHESLFMIYSYLKVFLVFISCLVAGIVFYKLVDAVKVRGGK